MLLTVFMVLLAGLAGILCAISAFEAIVAYLVCEYGEAATMGVVAILSFASMLILAFCATTII